MIKDLIDYKSYQAAPPGIAKLMQVHPVYIIQILKKLLDSNDITESEYQLKIQSCYNIWLNNKVDMFDYEIAGVFTWVLF